MGLSSKPIKLEQIEPIHIPNVEGLAVELNKKLEAETDPTVPDHVKEISTNNIADWNAKLAVIDIVDNLTTNDAAKTLSAAQGVVLKQFVDDVMAILNSPDTTLDDLQEIVAYIKQNKTDLQNLSISNIAGLTDALANKEPIFNKNTAFNKNFGTSAGTVPQGNDSRFHTHDNLEILNSIDQTRVDGWDATAPKNIRIVPNGSPVVLDASDDVVVMLGDYQNPISGGLAKVKIPLPSSMPGKEFWLINHTTWRALIDPTDKQIRFYDENGAATDRIQAAVHLKSDGIDWYQTNNYKGYSMGYVTTGGETLPPLEQIVKYKGPEEDAINLPDPTLAVGKKIKIIFESSAMIGADYIDTDGSLVKEVLTPAGSVVELMSNGVNYEKIN